LTGGYFPKSKSTFTAVNGSTEPLFTRLQSLCYDQSAVTSSQFHAWKNGVVTTVLPVVQRNCMKLFMGDESEINKVKAQLKVWKSMITDDDLLHKFRNCSYVQRYFNNNLYITKLEKEFPIAYSFLICNNPQQVVRLLRYLYRPQNIYCIHPDVKSSDTFKNIFKTLVTCLDNVIIPKNLLNVEWGKPSKMEAQVKCLRELTDWRSKQPQKSQWKYVINLCGKELPLTTTHETVTKLTRLNGTAAIAGFTADDENSRRRLKEKEHEQFLLDSHIT